MRPLPNGRLKITKMELENVNGLLDFDFPHPPSFMPAWAIDEARQWHHLGEFDILVKAEEMCRRRVELEYVCMSFKLWGLHVARGVRACIFINSQLPLLWQRFALFHELYHLLKHKKGETFWLRTATPMNSFEYQADLFAWAAIWPDWIEGEY